MKNPVTETMSLGVLRVCLSHFVCDSVISCFLSLEGGALILVDQCVHEIWGTADHFHHQGKIPIIFILYMYIHTMYLYVLVL